MRIDTESLLLLRLEPGDIAAEDLERLTARLRRELLELDVLDVRRPTATPAPDGTRAADAVAIESLVVSVVTAPHVLRAVVGVIRDWLARSRAGTVHIEDELGVLHVTGLSSEHQERLIESWITRHAAG